MKTILVYRFSAFGDVAMCVPVIKDFLDQNPGVKVVFLSRKNFAGLFDNLPRVEFIGVNLDEYKGFFGLRRLGKELLSTIQPDFIGDLHDIIRSKILTKFFLGKGFDVVVLDKGRDEKAHLTDVWNIKKRPLKRTIERYADVFRGMGFTLILRNTLQPIHTDKNGIGVAPFAQHEGKMLPLSITQKLVEIWAQKYKVYLFGGGEKEVDILQQWEVEIPNVVNCAGKLSLPEELEQISKLEWMFSMDSANMHLSSLVGTRCFSFWGATHPFAGFLGYGQDENDVIQIEDLTCRPCSVFGDKACYRGDWACLHEMTIEKILAKTNV